MIYADFETRSAVDLKKIGAYEYARHPTTEVLSLAWAIDDQPVELWHPAFRDWTDVYAKRKVDRVRIDLAEAPPPESLFWSLDDGSEFEAHNAWFERCIWRWVMVERWGWPEIDHDRFRCSAALAASYALRAKLDHVTRDLDLSEQKDSEGHAVMMRHSKPRGVLKRERRLVAEENGLAFEGWKWEDKTPTVFALEAEGWVVSDTIARFHQERAGLQRLFAYNVQDVEAERALSHSLRPLPAAERRMYQLDQRINWRGLHMDRPLVKAAIKIGDACDAEAQVELAEITGDAVKKVSQRIQMKAWLNDQGVEVPTKLNAKGDYIETTEGEAMEEIRDREGTPEHVHRACEIWLAVNKTSTKKYRAIINRISDDDRVRESMRYHAASTGRWGGQGIQPHNFPRKCPKDRKGLDEPGDAMERVCQHVLTGDYELVSMLYGSDNVMGLLSSILRGTITPAPGHDLLASDYSAIEARGTFWIAGHTEGLEAFEKIDSGAWPGQDIYTWQASKIYGRTIYKSDDTERQGGKVGVLGCGYQMGGDKLETYAASMGVTLTNEECHNIVAEYREANWPVKEFWYETQKCAIEATRRFGLVIPQDRLAWKRHGRFLHCRLPSGRLLSYLDPEVVIVDTDWGKRPQLQFWGVDTYTRQWKRTSTYGGKLTENIVQALCRDIMVHDEVLSEGTEGFGSVEEFNEILSQQPAWADGFPIIAEGWRSRRYRK